MYASTHEFCTGAIVVGANVMEPSRASCIKGCFSRSGGVHAYSGKAIKIAEILKKKGMLQIITIYKDRYDKKEMEI